MKFLGWWFVGFGVFLLACGIAGYLSNPEAAKTALFSGSVFGGLSAFWGVLMLRGFAKARFGALASTFVLAAAFSWRAWAGWTAVAQGQPKLFASVLISLMLAASLASLVVLLTARKNEPS
jgi:uncharacterized membrane protein (UPF0136 family)